MRLHLEAQRKPKMNRQARILGLGDKWNDYGAVSLSKAAIAEATVYFAGINGVDRGTVKVEIRDAANPDKQWLVTVEREISYRVRGLRGGE